MKLSTHSRAIWSLAAVLLTSSCMVKPDGTVIVGMPASQGDSQKQGQTTTERNQDPVILSFTANPTNQTKAGGIITFNLDFVDRDGDTVKATWAATGGTLSATTGRIINWTPPTEAGTYVVSVGLNDGKGGAAEGALNVIVGADGAAKVSASPTISTPKSADNQALPATVEQPGRFMKVGLNQDITAISAISPDRVVVVGGDKISYSVNAGLNWNTKTFEGKAFRWVDFVDENRGWAITDGDLYQTTDGGGSWRPLPVSLPSPMDSSSNRRFNLVDFVDESKGLIVSGTQLFGSIDGGRTWKEIVKAPDFGFGWGQYGLNYRTDGTAYNGPYIINTNGNQFGVNTLSKSYDWAVGPNGKGLAFDQDAGSVVAVDNFGKAISSPIAAQTDKFAGSLRLQDWAYSDDASNFILRTDNGATIFSTNGGRTWQDYPQNGLHQTGAFGRAGSRLFSIARGWVVAAGAGINGVPQLYRLNP